MPSRNIKLVLSAQLLLQMRKELKNFLLKRCGRVQMVQLEMSLMVQYLERPLLWIISQEMYQDGINQSLLVDMLLVTNTKLKTLSQRRQVHSPWPSHLKVVLKQQTLKFTNSRDQELWWACITQMNQSLDSHIHVSNMQLIENSHSTWVQRIQSWRDMMEDSKIFSKRFTKLNIRPSLKNWKFGTSIDLLMIWLHTLSSHKVDMSGHARTMMVMYSPTLSLKALDPLVSWLLS